jgi:hypothetical protein
LSASSAATGLRQRIDRAFVVTAAARNHASQETIMNFENGASFVQHVVHRIRRDLDRELTKRALLFLGFSRLSGVRERDAVIAGLFALRIDRQIVIRSQRQRDSPLGHG